MQVGIASTMITPERPVWLSGFGGREHPSEGKYNDLEAFAVVFDNGETRVGILALDALSLTEYFIDRIREVGAELEIAPERMLINCSHTHCGPSFGVVKGAWELDKEYLAETREKLCGLLREAVDDLEESKLDYTVGVCTMGINRRRKDAEGKCAGMVPGPAEPMDMDVPVLRVLTPEGDMRAVVFSYACHPTTMGGYLIGTDYPGPARELLREAIPGCTPIFLQGCGGDVKPRSVDPVTKRFGGATVETVYEIGHELARAVEAALCGEPEELGQELDGASIIAQLPMIGDPTEEQLAHYEAGNEYGRGWAAWVRKTLAEKGKLTDYAPMEVQALRIGDVYLLGMSGEICVGVGLELKEKLPEVKLWTLGYSNLICTYFASRGEHAAGGYEVTSSFIYYTLPDEPLPLGFQPEAVDVVVDSGIELVRAIAEDKSRAGS